MELQSIQPHSPHRQPTLESQQSNHDHSQHITPAPTRFLSSLIPTRFRRDNNKFQQHSDVGIALAAAAKRHKGGSTFMKEYAQISHRSKLPLHTIFDLFVREPLATSTLAEREDFSMQGKTLADWLEWVHLVSNSQREDMFVMCSCTAENVQTNAKVTYWLLAFMPSQVRRLKGIPRKALAYLLSQERSWRISDDQANGIAEATEQPSSEVDEPIALPSEVLQDLRPSSSRSRIPINDEASGQTAAQSPDNALPHTPSGSISSNTTQTPNGTDCASVSGFSSSETCSTPTEFTLYWQSKPPKYSGDFDTYIWQPYRKPPPLGYVKVHIINTKSPRNLRMILLFDDIRSLCAFLTRHRGSTRQRVANEAWSPVNELVRSISIVFTTILSDMVEFLQCSSKELTRLTFECRAHPRVEKMQYLLHLNDCRKQAELDMERNKNQLEGLVEGIKSLVPAIQNLDEEIEALSARTADLDFVLKELASLGKAIENLQKEIVSQNSLKTRNSSLLTFLAAVYIPLAFVTSFLGMNVTDTSTSLIPNSDSIQPNLAQANSTQANSTQTNSTQPISSGTDPTQRLWDLRWFAILSAPLLFVTIIFPLVAGPSIRLFLQMYLKTRRFWRFFIILMGAAYFICYCYYRFVNMQPLVNKILLSICDLSVLLIGVIRWYDALRDRKKRVRWSLFVVYTLICVPLDVLGMEPVLMGAFAWLILVIRFLISYGYFGRLWGVLGRILRRLVVIFTR